LPMIISEDDYRQKELAGDGGYNDGHRAWRRGREVDPPC
jgi:hypothetical protein